MNADQNNLPPILKPPIWKRQIKIRFILYPFISFTILLILLAVYAAGCFDSNRTKINEWLKFHQLAELPQTATNIMYYQWNGLFTGETYIKFQMPSNDLAMFIKNSSDGLSQGKSDTFTPEHQHLLFPDNSQLNINHSYYSKSRMYPDWYNPTITNKGRGYILWRGPNSEVYIDEDSSTIYLHSVKG